MDYYAPDLYRSTSLRTDREPVMPFQHPLTIAARYNEDVLSGKVSIHEWQKIVSVDYSREYTEQLQNDINVKAANGSGKSVMLIAPCAVWSSLFPYAETVVTSASGVQLDRQTGRHIKALAASMNAEEGQEYWTIQNRKLTFGPTDATIDFFATDEAGQAEGWHPRQIDCLLSILVDEAKSVKDTIAVALDRCHDAQRYLKVSSTNIDSGFFYRSCTSGKSKVFTVNVLDCPHIGKHQIDKITSTYGEFSPITRSILWAEFASTNNEGIINREELLRCIHGGALHYVDNFYRIGIDLAAGGDESVIVIFKGNKQIGLEGFVEKDTTITAQKVNDLLLNKYNIRPDKDNYVINVDDGGVGRGIADQIRNHGWQLRRILNNSAPFNKKIFLNRGAELYFNASSLVTNKEIIPMQDDRLISQLTKRKLGHSETGRFRLEDKKKLKSREGWSPDRADAFVLALAGLKAPYFTAGKVLKPEEPDKIEINSEFKKLCIDNFLRDQRNMLLGLPMEHSPKSYDLTRRPNRRPKTFVNIYKNILNR